MQLCIPKCPDMCYRIDIGCYILESWEDVSIGVEWLPNFSFFRSLVKKALCNPYNKKMTIHISAVRKKCKFSRKT